MATNPNPSRITNEMWRFWEELKKLQPRTELSGIYASKPGYHNTRAGNSPSNYSVVDSEDKGGPSDKAAALDWTFPDAQSADYDTIIIYSARLLKSGKDKNDPRGNGLREFFGQGDQDTAVEGWDFRYVRPATSDKSHLWHIHFSFDRDKVNDRATFDAVLSILKGETVEQWKAGGAKPPAAPGVVHPEGSRELRLRSPEMAGDDVKYVQEWIGAARAGVADGKFGPKTQEGVRWYQRMRGIKVDGIVGKETWKHMGVRATY